MSKSEGGKIEYAPQIFFQPNIDKAKAIILTPEAGMSTDRRWTMETAWLMSRINFPDKDGLVVDYGCGIGRVSKGLDNPIIGVDISPTMRANADIYVKRPDFGAVGPTVFLRLVEAGLRCKGGIAIWALQHAIDVEWDIRLLMMSLSEGAHFWLLNTGQRFIPSMNGQVFGWADDHVNVFELLEPWLDFVEKIAIPKEIGEPNFLIHLVRNEKVVDMDAPRTIQSANDK